MKRSRVRKVVRFAAIGMVAVVVFGLAVMLLWNWLMPDLFGWKAIGFGQALGLVVLSKLLFGGLHGGGGQAHWRHRMRERWERMTPEEREKFLEEMRGDGGAVPPSSGSAV